MQQSVPIRFYLCPAPSWDETIDPCDAPLYDWLASITPQPLSWKPQPVEKARIEGAVATAQAQAVASCEASKLAQVSSPSTGVSISVGTQLNASSGSAGEDDAGLRAAVGIDFAPVDPHVCGPIAYHILHRVDVVGSNYYPENTVISALGTPPAKTGTGHFADCVVFTDVLQTFDWTQAIATIFTSGNWRIESAKVFDHYGSWVLVDNPAPSAELQARGDAFDLASMSINLPGFPSFAPTGPRWLVVHRYSHESGLSFFFTQWITPMNTASLTWGDASGVNWGKSFSGEFSWITFTPDPLGDFFDPDGVWHHETAVIDYAMSGVGVEVTYQGDLCEQAVTTIAEAGVSPATATPLAAAALFQEDITLRTIGQYKAAYRITSIVTVPGVGLYITARVINPFNFAACIVARMPFGAGSKYGTQNLSNVTILIVRSLSANSESGDIRYLQPLYNLNTSATIDWKISDITFDAMHGGGFVEHGLACATGTHADGIYWQGGAPSLASSSSAMDATTDGQKMSMAAFFNPAGARFWSIADSSTHPGSQVVFSPALQAAPNHTSADGGGAGYIRYKIRVRAINSSYVPTGTMTYIGFGAGAIYEDFRSTDFASRYGSTVTVSAGIALDKTGDQNSVYFTAWSGGDQNELTSYHRAEVNALVASRFASGYYGSVFHPTNFDLIGLEYTYTHPFNLAVSLQHAVGSENWIYGFKVAESDASTLKVKL